MVSAVMAVPSDKTPSDVDVKDSVSPPPELLVAKQAIAVPKKIVPDTVVAETLKEDKSDETFVEVDAKSQSQAKAKSKSKAKAKSKMKFFFSSFFSGGFFNSCDSSRRRRLDENPRKGDPDCSGTDCQRGLSRRRRSNDCGDSVSIDSCFPASTLVETESRGAVEMKEVLVGERIKTAEGFSEVSCPV